jgi:nucleotide-binding universal stress UspA family protein
MPSFRRILIPTDFSEASRKALPHAAELARRYGAELVLMHAMEPPIQPVSFGVGPVVVPPIDDALRNKVKESLEQLRREDLGKAQTRCLVREGRAYLEIVQAAQNEGCDLIVIATHGYTGLKHMLLGSTTERVVRTAHCPVLTVKA